MNAPVGPGDALREVHLFIGADGTVGAKLFRRVGGVLVFVSDARLSGEAARAFLAPLGLAEPPPDLTLTRFVGYLACGALGALVGLLVGAGLGGS